jgi:hypothetical protein
VIVVLEFIIQTKNKYLDIIIRQDIEMETESRRRTGIDKLRINQLSDKAFQWYLGYLNAIDIRDTKSYVDHLSDGCSLQINSDLPVNGKHEIKQQLASFWTLYEKNRHDLLNIYGTDYSFSSEIVNHFTLPDGREITINAVGYLDRNEEGLLTSVRLYGNFSPLFPKM